MVCGKTPPVSRRLQEYGLYSGYHRLCLLRLTTGGGNRILTGINRHTVVDALPGSVSMGNRPTGEGLTGRGWKIPLPCLLHFTENVFSCE